ncbi:MAG: right-handed parallel beta-helix repeat-containing protein, partial [Clostridia bacterium]|nr:right-handed parallel beta-helix repeat-containing protein [Clostridia bacterium]
KATREQFAAIIERYDGSFNLAYNEPVLRSHYTEPDYPLAGDADFYVSTTGSDENDGSFEHPFATFKKAVEAVRGLDRAGRDGITVAFMAGDYGALDITLTAEDAGTAECPVTYCKYGDGDVVFNNGVTLVKEKFSPISDAEKSLFPSKAQNSIMKMSLDEYFPDGMPEGLAIYGENGPIREARYPDIYEDGTDHYLKDVFRLPPEYSREYCMEHETNWNYFGMDATIAAPMNLILNRVNYFKDMKMVGYIMYGWRVDTLYLKEYDKETCAVKFDDTRLPSDFPTVGIRTPQMTLDLVYFENSPGFLDAPDEYWYDADTNVIYVYEPCDEYTIGLYGNFLTFDDADFVSVVGLDLKSNRAGDAITVRNSEHVTLDRCSLLGVYSCMTVSGASDWFKVVGCDFSKFIGSCIRLSPTNHRTTLESNHAVIDNNYIHDYGLSKIFNNQAIMDGSIGAQISHNVFENSPGGAINLGMLSTIEYNVFNNLMISTQDFGIIYTWNAISTARHNTVRYNLFGDMGGVGGGAFGIYMDDFTQDQYIYGNLFWHSCIVLHNARDQYVYDNAFVYSNLNTSGFGYFYDGKVNDGVLPDGTGWEGQYKRYYLNRVNEGEEGYEIWKETFPSLYAFTPDVDNPTVYTSFFCPWDCIHNNGFIGSGDAVDDPVKQYGEVYDNVTTPMDENPYFVNPTRGDYTLKDGVDFFYIPFEEMGRY